MRERPRDGTRGPRRARALGALLVCLAGLALLVDVAAGSNAASSLNNAASSESLDVPRWLYLLTGGAAIGAPANPVVLVPPSWFGGLNVAFVLVGHLLAIWVAHAIPFDLFPGRLRAIRSEYPFVAVMISYTVISLWLISLPSVPLAYV